MNNAHLYAERIAQLRKEMSREGLDAYLIPTSDAFQSNRLPPESRHMEWLCGFTGENGLLVVTGNRAAVFVDGRFAIQVTRQVPADLFEHHDIFDHPPIEWLTGNLHASSYVGFDGFLHGAGWETKARERLAVDGIELVDIADNLVNRIWHERPEASSHPVILLEAAGKSSFSKRQTIGHLLREQRCEALLISHPECVNWLLNIRGRDIPCTPIVMSYGLLKKDGSLDLFIDRDKLIEGFEQHVGASVSIHSFDKLGEILGDWYGAKIHIDPDETPARLFNIIKQSGASFKTGKDPVLLAKARKNQHELEGMRRAHIRDGIAMCKFLSWLETEVADGGTHDECQLADKAEQLRQEQDLYLGPSFEAISSLGPSAALSNYRYNTYQPRILGKDGVYLLNCGGQYLDGTTDITRTVKVGDVSDDVIKMFTLVLKGHINLAKTCFPANQVSGIQLDAIARLPLWAEGYDYQHGTGHGVGYCLGVHERPRTFTYRTTGEPIEAGFVTSIEPGYYRKDQWGIRHENLYEVVECATNGEHSNLGFNSLTFVPFDNRLIDKDLLGLDATYWLNSYHQQVFQKIAPHLSSKEAEWLEKACQPL